jgi:hypothetical protein
MNALMFGAHLGYLAMVQWLLLEGGARIGETGPGGMTALMWAGHGGHLKIVEWLLEDGGSSMAETSAGGGTVWSFLDLRGVNMDLNRSAELTSLIKVMVMLADAPKLFIAKLAPVHSDLVAHGRRIRAQLKEALPAYLVQQRASVFAHCPIPAVLQSVVQGYSATTLEDMWTDGLC